VGPVDPRDAGGYGERAEIYLRLLAESALRPAAPRDADWVRRAADILIEAGVIADRLAAQILADLQVALRVRARPSARMRLQLMAGFLPGDPFGQPGSQPRPWQVFPAGQGTPGSRPMALIITADRALALATLFFPPDADPPESGTELFAEVTGTDNLGTSYRLVFTSGSWAGSAWTGTVMFLPAPPPGARWLALMGPNGQLLRVDMTAAPGGEAAPGPRLKPAAESPGERLVTRQAEAMLAAFALGYPAGHTQFSLAEVVAILEGAGALSPLSPAPARLTALGQLLGLTTEGPADQVPARWMDVMAYYGRRKRQAPVAGTAAIAAKLPEIDGTHLLIAGLRSGGSGSFLHILAMGMRPMPRRRSPDPPWDAGISWWFRDDAGGWHLGVVEEVRPISGPEGLVRLSLLPPLGHATTTLTVEITGSAGQVTANLPVHW
jgi:hypothetical protein